MSNVSNLLVIIVNNVLLLGTFIVVDIYYWCYKLLSLLLL